MDASSNNPAWHRHKWHKIQHQMGLHNGNCDITLPSLNSCPDFQCMVHQCAHFTHSPQFSHLRALLCICCYLKVTADKGLTFQPIADLTLDCYIDADFAGLYNILEHWIDPLCVKSHIGYILLLGGCPLGHQNSSQTSPVN